MNRRPPLRGIVRHAVCVLVLLAAGGAAHAQRGDDPREFAKRLVAAINTGHIERRKELAHPKSFVCLDGSARLLFEETFANQGNPPIPANYTTRVTAILPKQPLLFEDRVDYPVRPTHQVQIDFPTGRYSSKTIVLQVAYDSGLWREVWSCPKPDSLPQMLAARDARIRQRETVKALAAGMAEPLRTRILTLAQQGRKIDAIQQYRSTSGEDLSVAKDVVELLLSQPN